MTALTLNFNDNEIEIINEYMKVNKISLADLPSVFTNLLVIKKYNSEAETNDFFEDLSSETIETIKDFENREKNGILKTLSHEEVKRILDL